MCDDAELLAKLKESYERRDPVPAHVVAAAHAAGALLTAAIDWDWLERLEEPVGVRGPSATMLSFELAGLVTVDVELHREHEVTGLRGLLTPAADGIAVEICWPRGRLTAAVDELGRFDAVGLPSGPLRLIVRRPNARPCATHWFVS